MIGLTSDSWTVLAISRAPGHWAWVHPAYETNEQRVPLWMAQRQNDVIMMHHRIDGITNIVGRLAGPWWKRFQKNPQHYARRR